MTQADSINAGHPAAGRPVPLEILVWTEGRAVRQAVWSMAEALDVWARSGSVTAVVARAGENGAMPMPRPPVSGLVVTRGAGEACSGTGGGSGRDGGAAGLGFSRRVAEILRMHPEGIRKEDIVERVAMLVGRPPSREVIAHALWRHGRRAPADPSLWVSSGTVRRTIGRSRGSRPKTHVYPTVRKAAPLVSAFVDWTEGRVETLRRMAGEGVGAARIATELGDGVSRNAVISKAHRLGITILAAPRRANDPGWSDKGVETLRRLAGAGVGAARIAAEIGEGITRYAVLSKARQLGLEIVPAPRGRPSGGGAAANAGRAR